MDHEVLQNISRRFSKAVNYIIYSGIEPSQASLARRIGVHQVQLNRLLNATKCGAISSHAPTVLMIASLCDIYGLSCEWIMTGRGVMTLPEIENDKLKRLEKQFAAVSDILTTEHKALHKDVAERQKT